MNGRGHRRVLAASLMLGAAGCAGGGGSAAPAVPVPAGPVARPTAAEPTGPPRVVQPLAPPAIAQQLGLMPLDATGVAEWRRVHPAWDGRGVLIAILDSGGDLGVAGLQTTTTGVRKVLDLRDVSGEGDVPLAPVAVVRNAIVIDSNTVLSGAPTVAGLADDSTWYGGVLRELPFGEAPAADFNANGTIRDRYGVVVVKSNGRWIALIDTNGDGSLSDESPLSDFLVRQETFTMSSRFVPRGRGPITGAVNLSEVDSRPRLSIVLDTGAHGTHVAGIAAGHDMYGLAGFDGVAPGAQLIVVKMANNARGGVTSNGSMLRAMEHAARFAAERRLPLVINISFGIGNEQEGRAAMDSIVDAFARAHPAVLTVIAAGNDGPGTSTVGLPGSAELALTAGASYPGAFSEPQFGGPSGDVMGWWSSRGGELAKPDVVVPGMAYSTVPRWNTGEEIKLGTSMAAPHLTGMAALLLSAATQQSRAVTAAELAAALRASARPIGGANAIEQGAGMANIERAWRWLAAGHIADVYEIQAVTPRDIPPGMQLGRPGVAPARPDRGVTAMYRRDGLLPADTVQRFRVALVPPARGGPSSGRFRLVSEAGWLRPVRDTASIDAATGTALIDVRLDRAALRRSGRYVGSVAAFSQADSAAGPLFRLVSTIIVPDTATGGGRVLSLPGRKLSGGAATRAYVAVPEGAGGLAVRATLRGDTMVPARLYLFEPSGRPARTMADEGMGGQDGARASLLAEASDVVPGVYEVVVQAMPGHEVNHDLDIAVPAVRVTGIDFGSPRRAVTFASSSAADTVIQVTAEQLGMSTSFAAAITNGAAFERGFAVPSWARSVVVEVSLEPSLWNDVTDLAISVWDHTGQRLGGGAMNYPFHRVKVDLPEQGALGYRITAELFPGFARPTPPAEFPTRMRVTFMGAPRALGEPVNLPIRARDSASWELPAFTSLAEGEWSDWGDWGDWVRVSAAASQSDWIRAVRSFAVPRP
jgi:subtilisin family serine protease